MPVPLPFQEPVLPPTVVVAPRAEATATTSAADFTVLTAEDLARTGARSLPQAIGQAAGIGVWVQETNLGGGAPILRGLIGEKVLIVVDGVRLNDSSTRLGPNQSLNTIDPSIVERVEIVRGPAAVLYGSDAMGGAILIWTRRRLPADGQKAVQVGLDTHYESATNGYRASLHGSWAGERDGVWVQGSVEEWNELHSADEEQDFTGYRGNALFASWNHAFDPYRMLRVSARIHRDFDVPRTDKLVTGFGQTQPSNKVFDFELQQDEGYLAELSDSEPRGLADSWQARLFLRRTTEERAIQKTGSSTLTEERDEVQGFGLGVDFKKALGEAHLLTYGLDCERDDVTSTRFDTNLDTGVVTEKDGAFADDAHYSTFGLFVQDQIFSFAPYDVTAGVRYSLSSFSFTPFDPAASHEEGDFDALTGSLAVARDLGDHWRITGSASQAYRAPHLDDLAKNSQVFGGTELANSDLEPETSLTGELALDYRDELWTGALGVYHTGISNAIGRVLIDEGDPGQTGDETYKRENVGSIAILGAELRATRKLSENSPWRVEAGLAYVRGRQYDDTVDPATGQKPFNDVPASRIPPLNGLLALGYDAPDPTQGLSWGKLQVVAAGEQDELSPQDLLDPRIDPDGTPGWAAVHLDFGGPLKALSFSSTWSFGIHNIFNEQYRVHASGVDAPGLGVVLSVDWNM